MILKRETNATHSMLCQVVVGPNSKSSCLNRNCRFFGIEFLKIHLINRFSKIDKSAKSFHPTAYHQALDTDETEATVSEWEAGSMEIVYSWVVLKQWHKPTYRIRFLQSHCNLLARVLLYYRVEWIFREKQIWHLSSCGKLF